MILKFANVDEILLIRQVAYNKYTRSFSIQAKVIFSLILHKNVVIFFSYLSLSCASFFHKTKGNVLSPYL